MEIIYGGKSTLLNSNGADTALQYAQLALSQITSDNENSESREKNVGLSVSGRIALDIIKAAQQARNNRDACISIAEQTYQLVNAVDAGIKGGAIDTSNLVLDHIVRLNADLVKINKAIKRLGSWWTFPRLWRSQKDFVQCHDILELEMKLYILLIKCCLARSERQDSMRKTYASFVLLTNDNLKPST